MTTQDAIKTLRELRRETNDPWYEETYDKAIAALEKQIPKKPIHIDKNKRFDGNWKKVCPSCGRVIVERITTSEESYPLIYNSSGFCWCGQALDRKEDEE